MLIRYSSTEKKIDFKCTCGSITSLDIKDLQPYVTNDVGIFIRLPACECKSQSFIFASDDITNIGGHVSNSLARLAVEIGSCENKDACVARIQKVESMYEDKDMLAQFLGDSEFNWESSLTSVSGE